MKQKSNKVDIIFFTIIPIFVMIVLASIFIDHHYDEETCKNEFVKLYDYPPSSWYANDDWHTLNLGRDIDCYVFWVEDAYLTSVQFKNGDLTLEKIKANIYWKQVDTMKVIL